MLERILNLYHTVKDLKWIQIRYQIAYRFIERKYKTVNYNGDVSFLHFTSIIRPYTSYSDRLNFTFLNLTHSFEEEINWDFDDFGKLWTYNLNYFDFLNQEDLSRDSGLKLIMSFLSHPKGNLEPYPTSLRLINWIRFVSFHKLNNKVINNSIYNQGMHLLNNIEYHLMGNHLLENGFALLMTGYYFNNGQFIRAANDILLPQLEEQILNDGGHFELSPMYHCIIFKRVLEAIDLIRNNGNDYLSSELQGLLEEKASRMYSWLSEMTYEDGSFPMFNDSTPNIAPDPAELFEYAKVLGIVDAKKNLYDSGYRKIKMLGYELYFDVGQIGPHYIPGHAHSDTLSFLMHLNGKPFLVDRGVSTYEKNELRLSERKTLSHNTVEINKRDQSAVWSGFRVGKKAEIVELTENENTISASHNGYSNIGVIHKRTINYKEKSILVRDHVSKKYRCLATFHFHPNVEISVENGRVKSKECMIDFENADSVEIADYYFSEGFNKVKKAKKVNVFFNLNLTTKLIINENPFLNG